MFGLSLYLKKRYDKIQVKFPYNKACHILLFEYTKDKT